MLKLHNELLIMCKIMKIYVITIEMIAKIDHIGMVDHARMLDHAKMVIDDQGKILSKIEIVERVQERTM